MPNIYAPDLSTAQTPQQMVASGANGTPTNQVVTPAALDPATPITVPAVPVKDSGTSTVAGGAATIAGNTPAIAPADTSQTDFSSYLKTLTDSLGKPASATDQYNADYAASGVAGLQDTNNTDMAAYNTAKGKLDAVNAQLQGLDAQAKAIPIQTQENAANGGANVTKGGLAPQNTAALRNNALQALPLQAEALAAQAEVAAAQGKASLSQSILQQAQDHLDKVYQIHQTDATNEYNYKTNLIDKALQYATTQQAQRLADQKTALATNHSDLMDAINASQALSQSISQSQPELAAKLSGLTPPDINSKTFAADLQKYRTQVAGIQAQIKPDALKAVQLQEAQASLQLKQAQLGVYNKGGGVDANGSPISSTDYKAGVPITAQGAAESQNPNDVQAFALATGLAAPSQYLPARSVGTPAGKALANRANEVSMATLGIPFNPAAAESAFKFRNSSRYQGLTANAPVAIQTIVQAAAAAQRLNLSGVKSLNNLDISTKANGLQFWATPQEKSDAQTLQSFLALNQDDLGLILGAGTGSDYKTKLAGLIFDATGAPLSTQNLSSSMVNKITDKLGQYYTQAGVPNGKAYAVKTAQDLVNGSLQDAAVNTSVQNANPLVVTDPTGTNHTFATQAQADAFKKAANIP